MRTESESIGRYEPVEVGCAPARDPQPSQRTTTRQQKNDPAMHKSVAGSIEQL